MLQKMETNLELFGPKYDPMKYAADNDMAYFQGEIDGKINFARILCKELGIDYEDR